MSIGTPLEATRDSIDVSNNVPQSCSPLPLAFGDVVVAGCCDHGHGNGCGGRKRWQRESASGTIVLTNRWGDNFDREVQEPLGLDDIFRCERISVEP